VEAAREIQHHYLRIREVSRQKNAQGQPQYEATIYVARNESTHQYACGWMDVYGGLAPGSIGLAEPGQNELPFLFREVNGIVSFSNVVTYDPKADA
jgi:hypothetical protein